MKNDQLTELFESISSDILTDEIKLQLGTIFETTVNEAIEAKETELEESNKVEITEFKETLVEQVDSYLDYFVDEYIKENESIVEDYTKVKLAEKVLRNFKQMCEAFNISLSEESFSSEDEIEELQTENSKLVNKLIEAKKETVLVKKAAFIAEAAEKLDTDVQREKFVEMAKKLEFEEEIFEEKLGVIVDTILAKKEEIVEEKLEEQQEEEITPNKIVTESVASYLKYL
jgi:hypothetical protein